MAVKLIENQDSGLLGCWEISETTDQLLEMLQPERKELDKFLTFRNDARRREWLAARLLLKEMTGSIAGIDYNPAGKPVLAGYPGYLSISHSTGIVAIYYHPLFRPGIDVEAITRNITRLAPKFLSERELEDCTIGNQLSNDDLMLRWCAKEAVFKMVPDAEIDFAGQIFCKATPLQTRAGTFEAIFTMHGIGTTIPLHYRFLGNILMVWGNLNG